MSASQMPPGSGGSSANDPSMEDILASIRRILSEEEPAAAAPAEPPPAAEKSDDVLVLDSSMLVEEPEPEPEPEPEAEPGPPPRDEAPVPTEQRAVLPAVERMEEAPTPSGLLAPETAAAATSSVSSLMRTLATERTMQVHRGGPTLEDIVREELRPLLKHWLDTNLPDLVERLVAAEIERVVHRAVP